MNLGSAVFLVLLAGTKSVRKSFKKGSLPGWADNVFSENNSFFHKMVYIFCIVIQPRSGKDLFILRALSLLFIEYLVMCGLISC